MLFLFRCCFCFYWSLCDWLRFVCFGGVSVVVFLCFALLFSLAEGGVLLFSWLLLLAYLEMIPMRICFFFIAQEALTIRKSKGANM